MRISNSMVPQADSPLRQQRWKRELTASQQRLVELLQQLNFGCIEGLVVRGGQPVLDPLPDITREVKFGGDNGARQELHNQDFVLKSQVVELFTALDELGNGVIELLDVKHGLPFRMRMRDRAA